MVAEGGPARAGAQTLKKTLPGYARQSFKNGGLNLALIKFSSWGKVVAEGGIEPPTRRFSVACSTTELLGLHKDLTLIEEQAAAVQSDFLIIHLSAPAIPLNALLRDPHALGRLAGLIEHINRNPAARIPVTADAQPLRIQKICQLARN